MTSRRCAKPKSVQQADPEKSIICRGGILIGASANRSLTATQRGGAFVERLLAVPATDRSRMMLLEPGSVIVTVQVRSGDTTRPCGSRLNSTLRGARGERHWGPCHGPLTDDAPWTRVCRHGASPQPATRGSLRVDRVKLCKKGKRVASALMRRDATIYTSRVFDIKACFSV